MPIGEAVRKAIIFPYVTNNEAKYKVFVAGLESARGLGEERIELKSDF